MSPDLAEIFGAPTPTASSKMGLALLLRLLAQTLDEEQDTDPTLKPFREPELRVRTQFTPTGG